jgi:hypothetical protein
LIALYDGMPAVNVRRNPAPALDLLSHDGRITSPHGFVNGREQVVSRRPITVTLDQFAHWPAQIKQPDILRRPVVCSRLAHWGPFSGCGFFQ